MRTNLNSTSMRNTCPEFPLFGANYPGGTRRSAGLSPRGSRSGTERRSSGRRSGWTGSLVAVLTGG